MPSALRIASIEMVTRVMQNPQGARSVQETLSAYSHAETYSDTTATLSLTDAGTTGTASVSVTVTANQAGIAFLPATGHYYEYVADSGVSWTTAQSAAAGLSFAGQAGSLATIPTASARIVPILMKADR